MREEQGFQDWTQEQDDRLRASLGALRHDVDAAGLPDVRFVLRRARHQRHRAVAGIAAGAAAVLGLSWFGYQVLDDTPSTAPAGNGTVTTERDQEPTGDESTHEPPAEGTESAPVDRVHLFTSEASIPDLSLFVPPALWSSPTFTDGAATESAMGGTEGTALFDCDPDDVMWGGPDEGTFGIMGIWSDGSAFGTQRVRVLDTAETASGYVDDVTAALADCEAPAEADNIVLDTQPLELSGAYRLTTEFVDGTEPITDFFYVVQHEGTPEAVSTLRVTDWSGETTDAEASEELARLAGLVTGN